MLFGRGSNEDFIHLVTDIYLDGTFKIAPLLFSQVFVVCGRRGDCVLPLVFALLPNKSQYTYKRFLQLLREVTMPYRPKHQSGF